MHSQPLNDGATHMTKRKTRQTTPAEPAFNPAEDGVRHVNVYTRGATALGRGLSNFQDCNIEHPYFGHFRTLEGLWYFLKTGQNDEMFRVLSGHDCRRRGKDMPAIHYPLFNKMFKLGMVEKLDKNLTLQRDLVKNELPLVHYYNYHGRINVPPRQEWQLEFWQTLRQTLMAAGNIDVIRQELKNYIDQVDPRGRG